jgi:type II secretory pathway pseudopilin PulG
MAMIATSNKQRGATLVVALVLVALLSLLAIYGVGISVMDQRSSANEFRAKQAGLASDAAIDQAIAYLQANRAAVSGWTWTTCTNTTAAPCGTILPDTDRTNWKYVTVASTSTQTVQPYTSGFTTYFMTPNAGANSGLLFNIVAEGKSEDGTATNVSKQGAFFYPVIIGDIDAPMVAAGSITFNGNYSVVANPNGAGDGVPLSAWSGSNISVATGSPASCYTGDYLSTNSTYTTQTDSHGNTLTMCTLCTCPTSDALSTASQEGIDILDVDGNTGSNRDTTNFPSDVFEYMFGVQTADYQQVKQMATIISDCTTLNSSSAGFYWVTGNCTLPSADVGSFANPVLIVAEGGFSMQANTNVFGVLFAFSTNPAASLSLTLNGTATLYGAVMTNANIGLPVGTFKMRYDSNVLSNLKSNLTGRALSKIPGSWADF